MQTLSTGDPTMPCANPDATPAKTATSETLGLFGPCIKFLTPLSDCDDGYCPIKGIVPAGVVIPIHSHAERETFYVIEGRSVTFGRITEARSVLAASSMCQVTSNTAGETCPTRQRRS
jgi:hypothetical protein